MSEKRRHQDTSCAFWSGDPEHCTCRESAAPAHGQWSNHGGSWWWDCVCGEATHSGDTGIGERCRCGREFDGSPPPAAPPAPRSGEPRQCVDVPTYPSGTIRYRHAGYGWEVLEQWAGRDDFQYRGSLVSHGNDVPWLIARFAEVLTRLAAAEQQIAALRVDAERWRVIRDKSEVVSCAPNNDSAYYLTSDLLPDDAKLDALTPDAIADAFRRATLAAVPEET